MRPETLKVVEGRQFRERGLLHISDAAFTFFLSKNKRLQQEFAKSFDLESANDQVNF